MVAVCEMNVDVSRCLLLEVSSGKDSVSTDTETPFIFADVTDYLLDVSDIRDMHIAVQRPSSSHMEQSSELAAVVTDPLTIQRMSQINDD